MSKRLLDLFTHILGICRITTMNELTFYQTTLYTDYLATLISYMHTQQQAW